MSSTVTTVVSSVISNPAYTATFGLFVALSLVGLLAVVEVGSATRDTSVRRLVKSSSVVTAPLLVAFGALVIVRVIDVMSG